MTVEARGQILGNVGEDEIDSYYLQLCTAVFRTRWNRIQRKSVQSNVILLTSYVLGICSYYYYCYYYYCYYYSSLVL